MTPFNPVQILRDKRDGREHSRKEIQELIRGYVDGAVADYQLSAWLMACYLQGLSDTEAVALTDAMLHSGDVLTLKSVRAQKVDKHSTGGVGDKISLCLAPLVAACGVAVPMISGRGLGHTGGTLDKLEAIRGYRVNLSARAFEQQVKKLGLAMIGQTDRLAPADRRIYALRDVTATVECIPLIVASILSKKLAEGIDGLVLDVKVGRGAFMKDLDSARELARAMVRIGKAAGKRMVALLTDMSTPIGLTIGNALETREAIEVLMGEGPEDTRELTLALGAEMLVLGGQAKRATDGRKKIQRAIDSGEGLQRFAAMVRAQGGNDKMVLDPERLPRAKVRVAVRAGSSGYVTSMDALELGLTAVELGAGRRRAEDSVDPGVGIELAVKPGNAVKKGATVAWLHAKSRRNLNTASSRVLRAIGIGKRKPKPRPLILERITR